MDYAYTVVSCWFGMADQNTSPQLLISAFSVTNEEYNAIFSSNLFWGFFQSWMTQFRGNYRILWKQFVVDGTTSTNTGKIYNEKLMDLCLVWVSVCVCSYHFYLISNCFFTFCSFCLTKGDSKSNQWHVSKFCKIFRPSFRLEWKFRWIRELKFVKVSIG